ncbi:MAG: MBL fold metallo-hydrolase [Acidimicrobiia bacterium]
MNDAHITVLGGRGSIPVSGPDFVRYGGNTSCFAIVVGGKAVAFIDAGTGLAAYRSYGIELAPQVAIFLTHYHWDHIQGLSMLDELWRGACDVCVWGPADPREVLVRAIAPPVFPVSIDEAAVRFASVSDPVEVEGFTVTAFPINHPQGAVGYKVQGPNRSIAIVTDHESGTAIDDGIREAIAGVDVLVHDAQYLPSEVESHAGWGHSTYEDAIAMARSVGVSELILTSHDPARSDRTIDSMMSHVRTEFEASLGAGQGLEVSL